MRLSQGRGEGGPPPSEKGGPGLRGARGGPEVGEKKGKGKEKKVMKN